MHQSWGSKLNLHFHIVMEVQANLMRTRTETRSITFAYWERENNHYFQEISSRRKKKTMRISRKNIGIDDSLVRSLSMK